MTQLLSEKRVPATGAEVELDPGSAHAAGGRTAARSVDRNKHSGTSKSYLAAGTAIASRPPRILLAEDDGEMRALLAWALHREGYEVGLCKDGLELLVRLGGEIMPAGVCGDPTIPERSQDWDLIISDIRMPAITGLEILESAQMRERFPPIILITAFGDDATHAQAAQQGAVAVFDKPFDIDALLAKVRETIPPSKSLGARRRRKAPVT